MSIDISRVARAFCDLSVGSNFSFKLSHAQQFVAAALGFKSLAAYQAAIKLETPVRDNSLFVFIDSDLLSARGHELAPTVDGAELTSIFRLAVKKLYPLASIHSSWERRVSVASAIAGLVGLDPFLARDLDDARFEVIENLLGEVQGFLFNFDEPEWTDWAAHIRHRHGSLSVFAPTSFLRIAKGCEALTRFYVHGDQHEDQPLKYYCRTCDIFEDIAHFSSSEHKDNSQRYFDQIRLWNRAVARWKLTQRRPKNATNILRVQAEDEVRIAEAARSDFHRWIEKQVDRDDAVGFIAKDIMRDDEFPKTAKTRDAIVNYIEAVTDLEKPMAAVERAWKEFSAGGHRRGVHASTP